MQNQQLPPSNPARSRFFQQIRPCCVRLSRLAIQPPQDSDQAINKDVVETSRQILAIVRDQVSRDASVLDANLADYVFFPLSHVLGRIERHAMPVVETVVQCLGLLIAHGWRSKLSAQLVQQLLNLLTFTIDGVPGQKDKKSDVPEETAAVVFVALAALLSAAGLTASGSAALVDEAAMPCLGHAVSVVLDGVVAGKSPEVQLAALGAVDALTKTVKDHAALATFLPGTVSALTKVLSAPGRQKRRVVSACVGTLLRVLVSVLGDIRLRTRLRTVSKIGTAGGHGSGQTPANETETETEKVLGPAWVAATASQVKLALSTVLKLRNTGEEGTRKELERLCITLLDECHASLRDCAPILVESAIILGSEDEHVNGDELGFRADTTLEDLVDIHSELSDVVKTTVYDWMISLPRVMQASDETVKIQALRHLSKGIRLVSRLHMDSATLRDSAATALRDGVAALMAGSARSRVLDEVPSDDGQLMTTTTGTAPTGQPRPDFTPILMPHESQVKTRDELVALLANVGSASQQTRLAAELFESARDSSGDDLVSSYWLSFQLLRLALGKQDDDLGQYLDFSSRGNSSSEDSEAVYADLYRYSVSVIDSHAELSDADWRVEAIALEVTTFAASRMGQSFRPELIDVLYPIATFLGSSSAPLRRHAMVSLNGIATSCGYPDVSALVIDNADYMVNSVALRLNTLDVTPASTKVLTMMVTLAGPRLVPYLDDIVASIFAALDSYHGYSLFVENLFGVLKAIAQEGVRSDALLIEGTKTQASCHKKEKPEPITFDDVIKAMQERRQRIRKRDEEDRRADAEGQYPQEPWGKDAKQEDGGAVGTGDYDDQDPVEEDMAMSPTYELLLKIADLTQHYLTSPTPTLRMSLLDLLGTVAPALRSNQDKFLPLVNVVWPVVVSRLYDSEAYVTVAACDAICVLCSAAGDFLSTRVKTEWGDRMARWCQSKRQSSQRPNQRRAATNTIYDSKEGGSRNIRIPGRQQQQQQPVTGMMAKQRPQGSSSSLGQFAESAKVWEAVVRLLTAIVSFVRIDDETFDDMLDLLGDEMVRNDEVKEALELVNADAVWFAMYERGLVEWRPAPVLDGVSFPEMERMGA